MAGDPTKEVLNDESFTRQQALARRLSAWILAVGLILAAAVYSKTYPGDTDPDPNELNADNSKRYEDSVERIGGKSAVLGIEMEDDLTSLWHGRKLAYTLAGLSITASLLCFVFSKLTLHPLPPKEKP